MGRVYFRRFGVRVPHKLYFKMRDVCLCSQSVVSPRIFYRLQKTDTAGDFYLGREV